jgi:glycosyltransferase involved in cell wall biosynthesis
VYVTDTREIGGAERYLAILAERAASSGHHTTLLAPQRDLVAWFQREAPGVRAAQCLDDSYHDAPGATRRGAALLAQLPRLVRTLRPLAPDVVHINNGGYPGSDLCRLALPAARLAGVKRRVMTVHSNPLPRDHMTDPRIQAVADRVAWSCADVVVSPSKAVADGLTSRRRMPPSLGRTVFYGVAPVHHDRHETDDLRGRLAPNGELLVGMVSARPVAEKGYGVFLAALAGAGDAVRGAIVGPPPQDLHASARAAGVCGRLAIEGPRKNLGDYYAAFDALVVPSTAGECMPLVILEAASVGTPTFGSSLAGIPEAIVDGVEGRLFAPGDAAELAALIRSAQQDRRRIATMGRAARQRWARSFQIETMVSSTLGLYGVGPADTR